MLSPTLAILVRRPEEVSMNLSALHTSITSIPTECAVLSSLLLNQSCQPIIEMYIMSGVGLPGLKAAHERSRRVWETVPQVEGWKRSDKRCRLRR